jgi:hypothetical protein
MKRGAILNPARVVRAPRADRSRFGAVSHATSRAAIREAIPTFPDYRNGRLDRPEEPPELEDCTCAAVPVNAVLTSAIANGGSPTIPWAPQSSVFGLFGTVAGLSPGATLDQLAAVQGLDPMDVLKRLVVAGFDIGGQAPLVPLAGAVDPDDVLIALSAAPLYSAVTLYQADEDAMVAGQILDVATTPGAIVGGHMLVPFSLEKGIIWIATYGGWIRVTPEWLTARAVAHFLLHWEPPVLPAGIDLGVGTAGWETV